MRFPSLLLEAVDLGDVEEGHAQEDEALWAFVKWVHENADKSFTVHSEARRMLNWNEEHNKREKWYA